MSKEELPEGWVETSVGAIGRYINGRGFKESEWRSEGIPIIRIQNLTKADAPFNYSDAEHEERYKVANGDLLVAWAATLGVYLWDRGPAWLNQHIFRVEVEDRVVLKSFLRFALTHALDSFYDRAHGSGMVHIKRGAFESHPILLPPVQEQARIVSKIDELFSSIDEGERALERVRTLVEQYRQSVLKAAVTGELTREWREQHAGELESGEALLARILEARRQAWEQSELAKMKARGTRPPERWKEQYKHPSPAEDTQENVPDGWAYVILNDVVECLDFARRPINRSVRSTRTGNIPYYGANGQVGTIDGYLFDEPLILVVEDETFTGRTQPFSYKVTGKTWVNNHAHVLRTTVAADVDYLNYALMWYPFIPLTKGTTARRKLTQQALLLAPLPVPSLREQFEIASRISTVFSALQPVQAEVSKQMAALTSLRQTTLKAAFSGQLVPQDPNDEPASVLLERIKAERAAAPKRAAVKASGRKKAKSKANA